MIFRTTTLAAEYVNLEIMVPESMVGGLIGRCGSNISRIRTESGATIKVCWLSLSSLFLYARDQLLITALEGCHLFALVSEFHYTLQISDVQASCTWINLFFQV